MLCLYTLSFPYERPTGAIALVVTGCRVPRSHVCRARKESGRYEDVTEREIRVSVAVGFETFRGRAKERKYS